VRAVALLRVVSYHALGLPYAMTWFSAMPLMFFIAGYFMEASLRREAPATCIRRRWVRVLVPLAPYAVTILVVFAVAGLWSRLTPADALSYFVPLLSFPGPSGPVPVDAGVGWTYMGLWYLQNYMLFVLVSPLLRIALRRAPRMTAGVLAVLWASMVCFGVADRFATYLAAWTFGMAVCMWPSISTHRSRWSAVCVAGLVTGSTVFLTLTAEDPDATQQRWGVLSVLLLGTAWIAGSLAFRPQLDAFANRREVLPVVSWLNSRAVSVYLWHFPAYGIGAAVAHGLLGAGWDVEHAVVSFVVAIPATFLLATAFGWLEDVAARRPPVLIPTPERAGRRRARSGAGGSATGTTTASSRSNVSS
jgi:peptidoglycan/LPS O-acetylase OafA/YrhL